MNDKPRLELQYLSRLMPDIHGFYPDASLVGTMLSHTARDDQFIITDIVWMGSTDEWGYEHVKMGEFNVKIVRPLKDLAGNRHTGEPRYQESDEYTAYRVSTD